MKISPISPSLATSLPIRLFASKIEAGFPSPADDYIESDLDLNEYIVTDPAATFYAWASGDSMVDVGILNGDLLVVNRALKVCHGDAVIVSVDGELCCKQIDTKNQQLLSANAKQPPISIKGQMDMVIEGIVTHAIHKLK